ncbi:MAG: M17 family metallopeptidase [Vampirovibrionales bacterium]
MPTLAPFISVSRECPFTSKEATTVISPIWQAEGAKDDDDNKADSKTPRFPQSHALDALSEAIGFCIYNFAQEEGFSGARATQLILRLPESEHYAVKRVILVGLGKPKNADQGALSKAYAFSLKSLLGKDDSLHTVAVSLVKNYERFGGSLLNDEDNKVNVEADVIAQAVLKALYDATYVSAESLKPVKAFKKVILITEHVEVVEKALPFLTALNNGRALAKDLVNKPANTKTVQTLVDAATEIAQANPDVFTLTVVDDLATLEKEMPCFYTVARGNVKSDPPRFIHLVYKGKNASRKVALVGKSVIFDTGGYQVKPGNYMVTMKGDMAGGASVLGTAKALGELKPENVEVHIFLAATPNKIDADAMIPDSIVDTTCGKKVEIRHTDAEGRLTLIDAVTKANELDPEAIITIATLTGAAKMAVGNTICMMSNSTKWGRILEASAKVGGDAVQYVDVTPLDFENIKSKLDGADIRNTNRGSERGFQTAGAFVMSGAKEGTPVVHLDIAGADMLEDETSTGTPVATLLTFVTGLS